MDKRIISVALTGNWGDKQKNPAFPITPEEIADSAYEAYKAGASIAHIHVRDEESRPTMRTDLFEKAIRLIKEKCDIVINMTSSGGHSLNGMASDEARIEPFRVLRPEMGSYDCGTMNWLHKTVFENTPRFLEQLGQLYIDLGIKPEIEIFDLGMIETAKYYIGKGILNEPCHFQFIMGAPGGMSGTVQNLAYAVKQLPEGSTWSASGLSKNHIPIMLAALALGGNVRVGFEDNLYFSHGVLAKSNAELVARAADIIRASGFEVASPDDARQILGLKR